MLASFLKTGQSVDFALTNAIPDHMPNIELRVYDDTSQRVGSIILMPTEAITLAEHLQQLVEHVATHITQHIQEEEPLLNLHPRAEQLMTNADLNTTTGEHKSVSKIDNGNHAPATYNVEIDPSWTAHISEEPDLSAALMPTKQQIAAAEANLKRRQDEVNDFVSWLRLVPRKPNDALSSRSYFDVTVSCEGNPWDEAVMPIAVDSHPWVRSKAMREVILSAFRQGFQYGINWEESRNEGEL
jgi:hypothetical protein